MAQSNLICTPLQFITRWTFNTPADCLASFDFTIAQAMIYRPDGMYWHAWVSDRFFQDLAQRRLIYTSPNRDEDAGGSMMRVLKFLKRGYSIQAESSGKVIARIVRGIDMTKMESDGHHSTEEWWALVITGLLREDGVEVLDRLKKEYVTNLSQSNEKGVNPNG